jgi:hypothetical protein
MRLRAQPLPDCPDRAPYIRVRVAVVDEPVVLRVPSVATVAKIAGCLDRQHVAVIVGLVVGVSEGQPLLASLIGARASAPGAVGLAAALLGLAWADPVLELETPRPPVFSSTALEEFGGAVLEELHEAGWSFGAIVAAVVALLLEVEQAGRLEDEVAARIRFFAETRARATAESSRSRSTSSADDSAPSTP